MLGIYCSARGYNKGLYLPLVRVLYLILFYSLGILYKKNLEEKDKISNLAYFSTIFVIQLIIITIYGKIIRYTPSWCNDFTKDVVTPFIIGFIGIAFWLMVSKIIEPIVKESKAINCIASKTYSIMVHHFLGFFVVKTIFAILSKISPLFKGFNWIKYKTDIWYYYLPKGIKQWYIVYLIAGIVIPIIIDFLVVKIKKLCKNFYCKCKLKLEN